MLLHYKKKKMPLSSSSWFSMWTIKSSTSTFNEKLKWTDSSKQITKQSLYIRQHLRKTLFYLSKKATKTSVHTYIWV